ncbi:MAG: FAD-dependent oxidoreductase [Dictyoglomaceae bacterium]
MRHVIIGNSIAGAGCIEGIRKISQEDEIIVISDEPYHIYSRPLISYWLSGKIPTEKIYYRPLDYYEKNKVKTILGKKAIKVDFENQKVILEDNQEVEYDKLLIATGGKPFIPPIKGYPKENVFTFIKFDDVRKIDKELKTNMETVVVGAGLSGLKAVEALIKRGCKVKVVELANKILGSILDDFSAKKVKDYLEEKGIEFYLENSVVEILGKNKAERIILQKGEELKADILIIAIGVIPNIDIFRDTPLNIRKGILVNERMETNINNVYAAGDVVESLDLITGNQRVIPILPNAYTQGRIAGINMAGGEAMYDGSFPINSIGFFDIHIMTGGINNPQENTEILEKWEEDTKIYKKIYIDDNKITGFIFINSFDRTGIIVDLMRKKVNISEIKHKILSDSFGLLDFPREFRREKIFGGV